MNLTILGIYFLNGIVKGMESVMDTCQRCGVENDPDLRTLFHSCFYEMDELNLPFSHFIVEGKTEKQSTREEVKEGKPFIQHSVFNRKFYTLRVCKECRASWLQSIQKWFNDKFDDTQSPTGSGIYKRHFGTTIED